MYTDKLLRYAIPAQKKFKKMYDNYEDGLIAICADYVQVTEEKFKHLVDQFQGEIQWSCRKLGTEGEYHLEMNIDGCVFVAVATMKEMKKVGLK